MPTHMDAGRDDARNTDLAASLDAKVEELGKILENFKSVENKNDNTRIVTHHSDDFEHRDTEEVTSDDSDIEIITKEEVGEDALISHCGAPDQGPSPESQNETETKGVQKNHSEHTMSKYDCAPNLENVEMDATEKGMVPGAVDQDLDRTRKGCPSGACASSIERTNDTEVVEKLGHQASDAQVLAHTTKCPEAVKRGQNSGRGRYDQESTSELPHEEIRDNPMGESDANGAGTDTPNPQILTTDSMVAETRELTVTESKDDPKPSSHFEVGAQGSILSKTKVEDIEVNEENITVGNQTAFESKGTQTEESDRVGEDHQQFQSQFQDNEILNRKRKVDEYEKNKAAKINYHEGEMPESERIDRHDANVTQTKVEVNSPLRSAAEQLSESQTIPMLSNATENEETTATATEVERDGTVASVGEGKNSSKQVLKQNILSGSAYGLALESAREATQNTIKLTEVERIKFQMILEQKKSDKPYITAEDIGNLNPEARGGAANASSGAQCINQSDRQAGNTAGVSESLSLVKCVTSAFRGTINEGAGTTAGSELRTLEDSLTFFDLFPRLLQLEENLKKVRRRTMSPEKYEEVCTLFDKELQQRSLKYHPDRVKQRGGTEEEVTRAKHLQAALNATRTVLNTLKKIFLQDIDIDHSYAFFTKLDIGLLGNEDEVESHAYDVLFKISLVSEIKQENIVSEIRRFLEAARLCVESYFQGNVADFVKYRGSAFFHLKRCVMGYRKLHAELKEVEKESKLEKLHNIYPMLHRMKRDCWDQLEQLEALFELSKLPFGDLFPMYYSSTSSLDDYFVLPFDCYVTVIMLCSIMLKSVESRNKLKNLDFKIRSFFQGNDSFSQSNAFDDVDRTTDFRNSLPRKSRNSNSQVGDDAISLLYKLASYYGGDKRYKESVKMLVNGEYLWNWKETIKNQFDDWLGGVHVDLKDRFQISDYVEKGTKKYILKELKNCREMKAEFEEKMKEVICGIRENNKNKDYMKKEFDKMLRKTEEVRDQLKECSENSKAFRMEIEKLIPVKLKQRNK